VFHALKCILAAYLAIQKLVCHANLDLYSEAIKKIVNALLDTRRMVSVWFLAVFFQSPQIMDSKLV